MRAAVLQYETRAPEQTLLYGVVASELETFLARQRSAEHEVTRFVEREFRAFLECGVLSHGFLRVHCGSCGMDRVVGFSCKKRGWCPSCGGRRMAETAAHLVDHVLPHVPMRQWVLSVPHGLRYRMAYDADLLSRVMGIFSRVVFQSLRIRASECGIPRGQCGAVTFVQRFGSALNLHPHGHMICTDGVYAALPGESPRFYPLAPPGQKDIVWVAQTIATRIQHALEADLATDDTVGEPWLAELYIDGVGNKIRTGPRSGQKTSMAYGPGGPVIDQERPASGIRCADYQGFSVHANVAVRAADRKGLESLCKYAARPPLAHDRLEEASGGKLVYRMKTPWRNGATHVVMERIELIEKLAALVPRPRYHIVHYYGVLAPAAKWRRDIVPDPPPLDQCSHGSDTDDPKPPRKNYTWAQLMARTFEFDVLQCPRCGGRMKVIAVIESPEVACRILDSLGIVCRPPPLLAARLRIEQLEHY